MGRGTGGIGPSSYLALEKKNMKAAGDEPEKKPSVRF